jgi:hypothetical protein
MRINNILSCFLLTFLQCSNLSGQIALPSYDQIDSTHDQYVQALASLLFHAKEWETNSNDENHHAEEKINFSNEDLALLWEKVSHHAYHCSATANQIQRIYRFEEVYRLYHQAKNLTLIGEEVEAQGVMAATNDLLYQLWEEAIESEEKSQIQLPILCLNLSKNFDPNLKHHHHTSLTVNKQMKPYLLPLDHPMRSVLDEFCLETRITKDRRTFHQAGFKIISKGIRSFIHVARHAKMPGYLVKVFLDDELKEKNDKPSWKWLVNRCVGAEKIRNVIQKHHIKHFVVAQKWIYNFPPKPSPPKDFRHTRHLALLLVTDMDLTSSRRNLIAWHREITKEHLNELYTIICRAKGSSYRADNIPYTKQGQFAFIDTEYPGKKPDFHSIRAYLDHHMRQYWDRLVKRGGL